MFAVDGLEVRVWGERNDTVNNDNASTVDEENGVHCVEGGSSEEDIADGDHHDESDVEEPLDSDLDSDIEGASDSEEGQSEEPECHYPTHAEMQHMLHTSSRLLARTLASHQPGSQSDAMWMAQELGM
jgi:hypothetical protein